MNTHKQCILTLVIARVLVEVDHVLELLVELRRVFMILNKVGVAFVYDHAVPVSDKRIVIVWKKLRSAFSKGFLQKKDV